MLAHRFLLAVDNSAASHRELQYVAEMLCNRENLTIYLLHIYPDPPPDYYSKGGNHSAYQETNERLAAAIFDRCEGPLSSSMEGRQIHSEALMAEGRPLSQVILDKQLEYQCDTVVLGKRGISREEEFHFGSVSNTVASSSHEFAVWIIS